MKGGGKSPGTLGMSDETAAVTHRKVVRFCTLHEDDAVWAVGTFSLSGQTATAGEASAAPAGVSISIRRPCSTHSRAPAMEEMTTTRSSLNITLGLSSLHSARVIDYGWNHHCLRS